MVYNHNLIKRFAKHISVYKLDYTIFSLFLLLNLAHEVNFFFVQYATSLAGPAVPDFFDFLAEDQYSYFREISYYIHSKWAFWLTIPLFLYMYFVDKLKLIHILIIVVILTLFRAIVLPMTNLGIPLGQMPLNSAYTFGGDLFFSGHISKSFAFILCSRGNLIFYFLIAGHIFILLAILFGRYHYAIDIVAAYFITYTIYVLTKPLISKYFLVKY